MTNDQDRPRAATARGRARFEVYRGVNGYAWTLMLRDEDRLPLAALAFSEGASPSAEAARAAIARFQREAAGAEVLEIERE